MSKTARVVEEVRLRTETSDEAETVRDTVRSTRIAVDNVDGAPGSGMGMGITGKPDGTEFQEPVAKIGSKLKRYSGPERRRSANAGSSNGAERRAIALQGPAAGAAAAEAPDLAAEDPRP